LGTTPKTWLPPKNAAIETPPVNPRLPPPYTKWIFLSASTWPRWFANSKNSFSFPGLDPPKTQIFFYFRNWGTCHFDTLLYLLNEWEGREDFIDKKLKRQSYHLYVG
jgi:hypothetical protein